MKPSSLRERILLICLPAFLVIAVYAWLIYPKHELSRASEALQAAQSKEPSLTAFVEKEVQVKKLDEQLRAATDEHAALESRRRAVLSKRTAGSANQLTAVRDLTALMASHNLKLLDEGPLDGDGSAALPAPLQQAAAAISGDGDSKLKPTMWRLRFHGRYSDVLLIFRHLAEADHPAIPVQLLMDEVQIGTEWRAWTLIVWI